MSKLSDALKYLRRREGLSQEELATRCGVSRSTIGMMESGQRNPSREVLEAIADVFNVATDFLVGREDTGEYSGVFRKNLGKILSSSNAADLEAAGIDTYELSLIVDGTLPLTFNRACEIADELGETLDSMLDIEKPATGEGGGSSEITAIFTALSPENRAKLLELSRLYLNGQHNSGEKQ